LIDRERPRLEIVRPLIKQRKRLIQRKRAHARERQMWKLSFKPERERELY